jgi:tetratricopeptide (TPR) repeat protein
MAGIVRTWAIALAIAIAGAAATGDARSQVSRSQARAALEHRDASERARAVERLAEIGTMADAELVARRLRDEDPHVREFANLAMWQIWGRSGDKAIDALFERGAAQMQLGDLAAALSTFDDVVRRMPAFAEGWNKRATILFLMDRLDASLSDCLEVLKRNKLHYGALSGMGQIHMQRGELELALQRFRQALQVNPHLPGVIEAIRQIERQQARSPRIRT